MQQSHSNNYSVVIQSTSGEKKKKKTNEQTKTLEKVECNEQNTHAVLILLALYVQ